MKKPAELVAATGLTVLAVSFIALISSPRSGEAPTLGHLLERVLDARLNESTDASASRSTRGTFPGQRWERVLSPEEQGWSSAGLLAAKSYFEISAILKVGAGQRRLPGPQTIRTKCSAPIFCSFSSRAFSSESRRPFKSSSSSTPVAKFTRSRCWDTLVNRRPTKRRPPILCGKAMPIEAPRASGPPCLPGGHTIQDLRKT